MPTPRSIGYVDLLRRNRRFRLLFAARGVSLLGDWFNVLAVFALIDRIRGAHAEAFGWILILKLLPLLVMGPTAGVVADRYDRRAIMIGADLARAAVVLGFLALTLWPRLDLLYGLTVLQISLSAFFEPARTAAMSQICDADELLPANALSAVTWSIMLTLGAALGGLANHAFGWQVAICIDAASYLVSALLVLPVHVPAPRQRRGRLWHTLGLGDALDGFHYMRRNKDVATMVWAKGAWGVGGAITLMLAVFGQRVYPVHASAVLGIAVFYTARGLGTGLGPIVSRWLSSEDWKGMSLAMQISFVVAAGFYVAFGSVRSLPLAALFVVLAHFGGSAIWVFSTVALQRAVPNSLQGRVFAAELALFTLTFSISTYIYGRLLDQAHLDPFLLMRSLGWVFLAGGLAWALAARLWPLRHATQEPPVLLATPLEEAADGGD